MTFNQIRRLVETLKRKYADELEVYRLQPVAQRFCDDMANAVPAKSRDAAVPWTNGPKSSSGGSRNAASRLQGLAHLSSYLERCLDRRVLPQASEILRQLLPQAARRGLIPRSVEKPVPF